MDWTLQARSPFPVVVIGNGPSAICLSYFLSGYRPYFKESSVHPNPILQQKLKANQGKSIVDQDLQHLSEGLVGRSHSPVAVLFDSLLRPDADLGVFVDSVLTWTQERDQYIPHLVLGKGPVGGAWHCIEGSMFTLSLGDWMELPDLPFRDWMRDKKRYLRNDRAMTSQIAQYYQHYVRAKGLEQNFVCGAVVTSVRRLDVSAEEERTCADTETSPHPFKPSAHPSLFEVNGHNKAKDGSQRAFSIRAENIVLASGTYDSPAWLGIQGEELPFVHHTRRAEDVVFQEYGRGISDPILVVGAGLSAADAVISARHSNVPVIHTFRRTVSDPELIFNQLPRMMYPEYHKVHQMMAQQIGTSTGPYDGYLSLPEHRVLAFRPDNKCVLRHLVSGVTRTVQVSAALILIGSDPNLAFLPDCGRWLAVCTEMPVNTKRNPIDVNCYTYQCVRERGLYALGPLVGDNFVRFLQGGALAVTSALVKGWTNAQCSPAIDPSF
ncbi:oxidative stress-induced growth inhibitor 1-like [Narcine bancroftii]|uniref:oxidative stress-induced growth inhibitor 1-like n=1 Tax=Narcine bancroftii TaxID=1343680 RepID=UPI003832256D